MASSKFQALWNHPAGPKTTVTSTGLIWSRYSTCITPKNWNLFSVNIVVAGTCIYKLSRKIMHDYSNKELAAVAKE